MIWFMPLSCTAYKAIKLPVMQTMTLCSRSVKLSTTYARKYDTATKTECLAVLYMCACVADSSTDSNNVIVCMTGTIIALYCFT